MIVRYLDVRCEGIHRDGSLQPDISGGGADKDVKFAALYREIIDADIEEGKGTPAESDLDSLLFSGLEEDLAKTAQLFLGAEDRALNVMDIDLSTFSARGLADILDLEGDGDIFILIEGLFGDLQAAVFELSIG